MVSALAALWGLLPNRAPSASTRRIGELTARIRMPAGIPESEVWLHEFRATFTTRSLWAGVDLRTVQD